jgi:serine phosphatase RsbU (regulator of sigma subunit)
MLHYRAKAGRITRLGDEQLPIGLLPQATYISHTVQVQANDLLLIATDGILDAENRVGEAFGLTQLEDLLLKHREALLPDIADRLHEPLSDVYRQSDDQILLIIRFR